MQKVRESMKSSEDYPMNGVVNVDEQVGWWFRRILAWQ